MTFRKASGGRCAAARGAALAGAGLAAAVACHDPHDVATLRAGLRLESPELCLRCHRTHRRQPSRRGG